MNFRGLQDKWVFRTATDSLIRDFYLPALSCAVRYDRAVGYFSSSMLSEAAFGLSGLIKNQGVMRLLIGNPLTDEDWEAVKAGNNLSHLKSQIQRDLAAILERAGTERTVHSFELLSWMVATGSIEIRFAFRKVGMYHEKIGVLADADSNTLVFSGSANESANALLPTRNFESITVFPSWKQDVFDTYGAPFQEGFESLWNNTTPGVLCVPVPSEFYETLRGFRKEGVLPPDLNFETALHSTPAQNERRVLPSLPATISGNKYELKPHQRRALEQWQANAHQGIFALATGSGKTVTALHAATRFVEQRHPIVLIVAVPYQILAEQWVSVMGLFQMEPIRCFYSQQSWIAPLDEAIAAVRANARPFLSIVVVNDTLSSSVFQERLALIPPEKLFFVADECHHHAGPQWPSRIPHAAKFKIGLSATPWNPNREEQKAVLQSIYGPVVATYTLKNALDDGVLCPYTYDLIPCAFDEDEAEEYQRLSHEIASLMAQDPNLSDPRNKAAFDQLYSRRVRLLGSLRDKGRQLDKLLRSNDRVPHTLFYCGEGTHPIDGQERAIDHVVRVLHANNWKASQITASETMGQRLRILESFGDGMIEGIAAMRVLDEGFDIPSCRTAFIMASSSSYRQFVQRRGRILRLSPGKTIARILDFVPVPSRVMLEDSEKLWKSQVRTELARIREFVELARNPAAVEAQIRALMHSIGLGSIYYEELAVSPEDLYGN